jgi:hypothetical protein
MWQSNGSSGSIDERLKESVSTYTALPLTDNTENDIRVVKDTDKAYTWGIAASSGILANWIPLDDSAIWGNITGKPSSSTANIDDAVSKKHSNSLDHAQGTDQGLDIGGPNAVTAAQTKAGYTHSGTAHAPSDAVSLATVKGDTDVANAISASNNINNNNEDFILKSIYFGG